jgi:class 3 adenylate cyclase
MPTQRGHISLSGYKHRNALYLFADLRGFTKWAKESESELQQLLEAYYTCAQECFGSRRDQTYLRRVVKFLGDGFFAVNEYDNLAGVAAVDAAFAQTFDGMLEFLKCFRTQMNRANFHQQPHIASGFGLSFGASVRFSVSGHPLDYAGSQVNIAARLCSKAAKDQLIMEKKLATSLRMLYEVYNVPFQPIYETIELKGLPNTSVAKLLLRNISRKQKG